jgi:murein DD-endopeptidase MepM/ murein hydrolase activator NlpD
LVGKFVAVSVLAAISLVLLVPVVLSAPVAAGLVADPTSACTGAPASTGYQLDKEQASNAATIIATVNGLRLPARAAVIAISVALQESGLHNLDHGDSAGPDSRGLFQQRATWGPLELRMNPAAATKLFVAALVKIPGWSTGPLGVIAETVQHSADLSGSWYAVHESEATALVASYKSAGICPALGQSVSLAHSAVQPMSCPGIRLTQGYGPTALVGEPVINGVRFHTGWDLACPVGTTVVSVTGGQAHVTLGWGGGFGNNVQVHVGDLYVRYAHLEAVLVKEGDQVAPDMVLGLEGSTGYSTGPHLHFEADRGCPSVTCSIDPGNLISPPPTV